MPGLRTLRILLAVFTLGLSEWKPAKRLGRLGLHRFCRFVLRLRSTDYRIDDLKIALVLAPHPDDEAFGCGGLIARKRLDGQPVHVVFLTDGSASHPGHPTLTPAVLTELRQREARESLNKLGVDSAMVHFLGIRDGTLTHLSARESANITEQLGQLLQTLKPDELFLPCQNDGSSEHEAAFRLLRTALTKTSPQPRIFEFPVWSWWNPFLLLRNCFTRRRVVRFDLGGYGFLKRAAIACHRSQISPCPPWPQPVQSTDFTQLFLSNEEFFYEN